MRGGSGIPVAVVPTEQPRSLVLFSFSFCPDLNCFVFRVLEGLGPHNARLQGKLSLPSSKLQRLQELRLLCAELENSCPQASLRVTCRSEAGTWQTTGSRGMGFRFRPPQAG